MSVLLMLLTGGILVSSVVQSTTTTNCDNRHWLHPNRIVFLLCNLKRERQSDPIARRQNTADEQVSPATTRPLALLGGFPRAHYERTGPAPTELVGMVCPSCSVDVIRVPYVDVHTVATNCTLCAVGYAKRSCLFGGLGQLCFCSYRSSVAIVEQTLGALVSSAWTHLSLANTYTWLALN